MKDQLKRKKKAWPTKAAMEQVYEMKLWGGSDFDFYSGEGSHDKEIVQPYKKAITTFLESFKNKLTVCDLGCGDFNIGKDLVPYSKNYSAVDIVEALIKRNKKKFTNDNLKFYCLDIAVDDLPPADCVIIRQVLQHLSNDEVLNIVAKLGNYKYLILTEHLPIGEFVPNKNIISGQGIRIKLNSGLDLLKSPFNLLVKDSKELSSLKLDSNKGVITTTLYTL